MTDSTTFICAEPVVSDCGPHSVFEGAKVVALRQNDFDAVGVDVIA